MGNLTIFGLDPSKLLQFKIKTQMNWLRWMVLHIIFVTPMTVNDVNLSFVFRRINGLNP
jgi:hypothetical protein